MQPPTSPSVIFRIDDISVVHSVTHIATTTRRCSTGNTFAVSIVQISSALKIYSLYRNIIEHTGPLSVSEHNMRFATLCSSVIICWFQSILSGYLNLSEWLQCKIY
jgi:hypothetical protein